MANTTPRICKDKKEKTVKRVTSVQFLLTFFYKIVTEFDFCSLAVKAAILNLGRRHWKQASIPNNCAIAMNC